MKGQALFSRKNKKNISKCLLKFLPSIQSVKDTNVKALTLIMLITTAADNILIFLYFLEKIRLDICLADDSHKMPSLIFSEK